MKIAILGWGSLIWDPRELGLATSWQAGGPVLPLEFSRISADGRLTLAIDERNGAPVPTRYALSSLTALDMAIADLQKREGVPNANRIGFIDLKADQQNIRSLTKQWSDVLRAWAEQMNFDAVIWTALGSNFFERALKAFSSDAALHYLNNLSEPAK